MITIEQIPLLVPGIKLRVLQTAFPYCGGIPRDIQVGEMVYLYNLLLEDIEEDRNSIIIKTQRGRYWFFPRYALALWDETDSDPINATYKRSSTPPAHNPISRES